MVGAAVVVGAGAGVGARVGLAVVGLAVVGLAVGAAVVGAGVGAAASQNMPCHSVGQAQYHPPVTF